MNETFIIANRTDVGKTREVNEDSMVTFDSPNGRVIAVCDGMGGQAAGDVASKLACEIISDILTNNKFSTPTEAITRACMAANQGILHRASQDPSLEGMGATCVMVIIKDGLAYYGWVGDSRIYYFSNGSLRQISRDQSYVQQLVDSGQISAAEADNHPLKNEILNALGLQTMTPPDLCAAPLTPEPGSILLLCSDGLSGMVDNATIESIVGDKELSLQRKADKLVDRANVNGGTDNITVQLIQFGNNPGVSKKSKPEGSKSNILLWIIIIAVVIIAGLVIGFILGGNKEDKKVEIHESVDLRKSDQTMPQHNIEQKEQSKSSTSVIVDEGPTTQKKKDKTKTTSDNNNDKEKTFGKSDNKKKDKKNDKSKVVRELPSAKPEPTHSIEEINNMK